MTGSSRKVNVDGEVWPSLLINLFHSFNRKNGCRRVNKIKHPSLNILIQGNWTINREFLFRCSFYMPRITLSFKFNWALSVTAKARPVCQNLWTLSSIISSRLNPSSRLAVCTRKELFKFSPFRLSRTSHIPPSSSCRTKQIPRHWIQRLHKFRQCKEWTRGRWGGRVENSKS